MGKPSIPNWLKKRAFLSPDRIALIFEGESYTFEEVFSRSSKVAGHIATFQLKKGEYAGVLLRNHVDSVFILYALQMLGIRTVILNNRLTAEEINWQLRDSNASLLISENAFGQTLEQLSGKVIAKEELFDVPYTEPEILEEYDLDEVTTVMYTSGTTGFPKGVKQTFGNHWWSAAGSALNLGIMDSDCWLCTVPIFHISGYSILMRSIVYGMTVVLHESFDEKKAIADIGRYHISMMSAVSTMLTRILDELKNGSLPPTFRCMLLGGGPASLHLLQKCREKGIPVFQTYGMTETSSQFATLSPDASIRKLGAAGKPLFPSQLKIVGHSGEELPRQQEGEIAVKGPNVTPGYLNRKIGQMDEFRDGWFLTGDLGYMDEEGFLYVLDRRKDLIISGGENIYPAEIEGVLLAHPKVLDAGVIGMEDEKWGQVPIAFIAAEPGTEVTEKEVVDFCRDKLAKYKIPKKVEFVEKLPRNASKKLLRRKLRGLIK